MTRVFIKNGEPVTFGLFHKKESDPVIIDSDRYYSIHNYKDLDEFKSAYIESNPDVSLTLINREIRKIKRRLDILGKLYLVDYKEKYCSYERNLAKFRYVLVDKDNRDIKLVVSLLDVQSSIKYQNTIIDLNENVKLLKELPPNSDEEKVFNKIIKMKDSNNFKELLVNIDSIKNFLSNNHILDNNYILYNIHRSIDKFDKAIKFSLSNKSSTGKVITCNEMDRDNNTISSIISSHYFIVNDSEENMLEIMASCIRYYGSEGNKRWKYDFDSRVISNPDNAEIKIINKNSRAYKLFKRVYSSLVETSKLPSDVTDEMIIDTLYETTKDIEFVDKIFITGRYHAYVNKPNHIKTEEDMKKYVSSLANIIAEIIPNVSKLTVSEEGYSYHRSKSKLKKSKM